MPEILEEEEEGAEETGADRTRSGNNSNSLSNNSRCAFVRPTAPC